MWKTWATWSLKPQTVFRLCNVSMVVSLYQWFVIHLLGDGLTMGAGWDRAHTEWISVAQTQLAAPHNTIQPVNRPSFILAWLSMKKELAQSFWIVSPPREQKWHHWALSSCFYLLVALGLHPGLHIDRATHLGGGHFTTHTLITF